MQLAPAAAEILQRLHAHGHAAYLVGGCVRDMLLARPPKDWDIATGAQPDELVRLCHRVIVMIDGHISRTLKGDEITTDHIETTQLQSARRPS